MVGELISINIKSETRHDKPIVISGCIRAKDAHSDGNAGRPPSERDGEGAALAGHHPLGVDRTVCEVMVGRTNLFIVAPGPRRGKPAAEKYL